MQETALNFFSLQGLKGHGQLIGMGSHWEKQFSWFAKSNKVCLWQDEGFRFTNVFFYFKGQQIIPLGHINAPANIYASFRYQFMFHLLSSDENIFREV